MAKPTPQHQAIGCVAAVILFVVLGIIGAVGRAHTASTQTPGSLSDSFGHATASSEPSTPPGPVTRFGDGTFVVGSDIVAGTYKSAGPSDDGSGSCYWARLKNTTGDLDTIIANNISNGPDTVTISRSDGAFKTSGCQTWHKIG